MDKEGEFVNALVAVKDEIEYENCMNINQEQEDFYNDIEGVIKEITLEEAMKCAQVMDLQMWKLMKDVASEMKFTLNGRRVVRYLGAVHNPANILYVYSFLNKPLAAVVKDKIK